MYKVAVVIPIYNVEDYIVRCAESLFSQTLDDMQFIFVDDASPDDSIARLEQTIEHFPHRKEQTIILHHPENLGLPTARATGLARVEAPYVAHCDSDDYVEPTMYAKLYENAIKNDSDMVICGWKNHFADGREYCESDFPGQEGNLIRHFLSSDSRCCFVWCRLTRTEIYRKVRFPKENFLEDWVQTVQLLTYARRISFLNEYLYHYVKRPVSISTNVEQDVIEDNLRQCVTNFYLAHDFIVEHHHVKEKMFVLRKQCVRSKFLFSAKQWRFRKRYLQTFPEINFCLLYDRFVPLRYKVYHVFVLLGIHLIAKKVYRHFKPSFS